MSVRFFVIVGMCVLVAVGCRRDPRLQVYIDNMNAEKRMLEDTLYDLQYDYECKLREVEKLQGELNRIKGSASDAGSTKTGTSRIKSPAASGNRLFPGIPDLEPPTVEPGTPDSNRPGPKPGSEGAKTPQERPKPPAQEGDIDDLEPPTLELPDDANGGSPSPGAVATPNAAPAQDAASLAAPSASEVTQLFVDPARTGGEQTDDEPGDDGIVVCLEPRNKQGQFVAAPAPVTVILLDAENRTQLSKWDLPARQLQAGVDESSSNSALLLHLPWQGSPPQHDHLELVVRYQLPAGQVLEQTQDISVKPKGKLAERWTPRAARRPDPPKRSVRLADSPPAGGAARSSPPAGTGSLLDDSTVPATGGVSDARQANRPAWRPYR